MTHISGLQQLVRDLRKHTNDKLRKIDKGVKQAALFLQHESQKIVPVDEGPLKASAFTRKSPDWTKTQPSYNVGYTADYAVYAHEIPDPPTAHGKSFNIKHAAEIAAGTEHERGPNQTYKFLEKPAHTKRKEMLGIIARAAK